MKSLISHEENREKLFRAGDEAVQKSAARKGDPHLGIEISRSTLPLLKLNLRRGKGAINQAVRRNRPISTSGDLLTCLTKGI